MNEAPFLRATRAAYDTVAADYAESHADLADKPLDRAMLATFAEFVRTAGGAGPVADLGCGPGHVTAHLCSLGLAAFGVDLSSEMVAQARQAHPDLRFDEGSMTDLELPDGTLDGIVAFYSIMHTPSERLPALFAEFYRTLAPGGHLLLAFMIGDERRHRTEAFGHAISLDFHLRPLETMVDLLAETGLVMRARLRREPEGVERLPRAYLLARKPADAG